MKTETLIIEQARNAHRQAWVRSSHVSNQTKSAIAVCKTWQANVCGKFVDRFVAEHKVGADKSSQKIDLVDTKDRVAYEFKVSQNNPHFEFYRDVFKVLVFNRRNSENKLRKLIFITPEEGAAKLRKPFTDEVIAIASKAGLAVEIHGI